MAFTSVLPSRFVSIASIAFIFTLWGCTKEEVSFGSAEADPPSAQVAPVDVATKDRLLVTIARRLSEALVESSLREFVVEEARKEYDGDPNFPILMLADRWIDAVHTLGSVLEGREDLAARNGGSLMDSLRTYAPLAQIALYVPEGQEMSTVKLAPDTKVAVVPSDAEALSSLPSYVLGAPAASLDAKIAPDETVVVVNESERILNLEDALGGQASRCPTLPEAPILYTAGGGSYVLYDDYYASKNEYILANLDGPTVTNCGFVPPRRPSPPSTPPSPTTPRDHDCDRDEDEHGKDHIDAFKFASERVYKDAKNGWFNNDMEIHVNIVFATPNGAIASLSKGFDVTQKQTKNLDWVEGLDMDVLTWAEDTYGDAMVYAWHESDGGGTVEKEITISTKFSDGNTVQDKTKIEVSKDRHDLFQSIVEFCDEVGDGGEEYNTGRAWFKLKLD